ncbi:ABC transporter permease [Lentilactobacillus raoultii]|uniref:ABC transporter permease n=1 Tax=Lentilactobacillus raoultii TaxID=1987503 RepID=A0ABW3PPZ9_9LACO|nr:ABC transporter permease subunit [Lentilactobacillus raoultii]
MKRLKIYAPLMILVLIALIIPLVTMFVTSFQTINGQFSLENYTQIFKNHEYHEAIFNSLWISLVASVPSLLVAILGAWALKNLKTQTKDVLITFFDMSSSFAGIPLAFSLIILFGNAGVWKAMATAFHITKVFNIYSMTGMTFSYTFFEIPLGIMFLFPVFEQLNSSWSEASQVLGASDFFFLKKVALPIVFPNLIEVFILLFANAMGTYETAYALTGNNVLSIPILIGTLINGELTSNLPMACAIAGLFTVLMTMMVMTGNYLTRKREGNFKS